MIEILPTRLPEQKTPAPTSSASRTLKRCSVIGATQCGGLTGSDALPGGSQATLSEVEDRTGPVLR
ncbi:hypothetical protein [Streptomyces sennicomposti]